MDDLVYCTCTKGSKVTNMYGILKKSTGHHLWCSTSCGCELFTLKCSKTFTSCSNFELWTLNFWTLLCVQMSMLFVKINILTFENFQKWSVIEQLFSFSGGASIKVLGTRGGGKKNFTEHIWSFFGQTGGARKYLATNAPCPLPHPGHHHCTASLKREVFSSIFCTEK